MSPREQADRLIRLWQHANHPGPEARRIRQCYSDELHTAAASYGVRTQANAEDLARTLHLLVAEIAQARDHAHEEQARRRGLA